MSTFFTFAKCLGISAAVLLMSTFSLVGVACYAGESRDLAVVGHPRQTDLTIEAFLKFLMQKKDSWYLDDANGSVVFTKTIRVNPKDLAPGALPDLRRLMETGEWLGPNGIRYDFRKVAIMVADGKGGLGDFLAFFTSDEFQNIITNPFEVKYPASPYRDGMTPNEFLDALLNNSYRKRIYLDGTTKNWILEGELHLPLHNLPVDFGLQVVTLVMNRIWTSPSGDQYDFGQNGIVFPELGTPDERTQAREKTKAITAQLYEMLRESSVAKPKTPPSFILTMNNLDAQNHQFPQAFLDRLGKIELMKPLSPCQEALISRRRRSAGEPKVADTKAIEKK